MAIKTKNNRILKRKPKKPTKKKNQRGGWPHPALPPNKRSLLEIGSRFEMLPTDPLGNKVFKITVNFDTPDAGYYNLVNNEIKDLLRYSKDYATHNNKTINDILWQTGPFILNGDSEITITVKLFGFGGTNNGYSKQGIHWDEIACDSYGLSNKGIDELNIKAVPCSQGNAERRIFYKVPGNFFHYVSGLNDNSITLENHILFYHIAHYLFKTDLNNHYFVYSHNEDVPWFHIKAYPGQGTDVALISDSDATRHLVDALVVPIYGMTVKNIPHNLPQDQSTMVGVERVFGNISSIGMTFLIDMSHDPNGQNFLKMIKPHGQYLIGVAKLNGYLGITLQAIKDFNIWYGQYLENSGEPHWKQKWPSESMIDMFFKSLDEGNKNYLILEDWDRIPV